MTHEEKLEKNNEWRRAHKERVNEWNRQWREKNKGYWKEYRRRKKEERMKKQEDLSEETVAAEAGVDAAADAAVSESASGPWDPEMKRAYAKARYAAKKNGEAFDGPEWARKWREEHGLAEEPKAARSRRRRRKAAVEEAPSEEAAGRTVVYAVEVGGRWYECVGGRDGCVGCAFFAAGAGLCAAEGAGEMDAVRSVCGALGGQWAAMGEE